MTSPLARIRLALALACALALVCVLAWAPLARADVFGSLVPPDPGTSGQYLVKFTAGTAEADQAAALADAGAQDLSYVSALRLHSVALPDDTQAALDELNANPAVARVEREQTREANAVPSDPAFDSQWSLARIGWDELYGTLAPTGSATVALLDTGVNAGHADLAGSVVPGTSILDPGSSGTSDANGHGTQMAGIVAASTDNAEGMAGIGYAGVRVMPVTVLDSQGVGQDGDIINGVIWAADHGADVILMSFSSPDFSPSLQEAVDYAWSRGALLVGAAGNDGSPAAHFPAGDRGVIGVANTDEGDALNASSNYGDAAFMAAPGTGIYTTAGDGGYTTITGTSASAAAVAGAAALLKANSPAASNGTIVGRLARNADAAVSGGTGNGRLNLGRAATDDSTEAVQPTGSAPLGEGGPFVGPYAAAAATLSNATLNGATTVTVKSSASIGAAVTGTTGNGASNRWNTTGWRIATTAPGAVTCADTADVPNNTTNATNTFSITPPAAEGTYSAYFIGYTDSGCTANATNTITLPNAVVVDNTAPTVTAINRVGPTPTNASSVSWTVTFSESVSGVDAADFALANSGLGGTPAITGVAGSGATRTVTASTGSGSGTLGLNLVDNDSISDPAANALGGTGINNGNFTGQVFTVDRTPPVVSSIDRAAASPTNASSVSWTVTFSESVSGVTAADFALANSGLGGTPAITSVTGSGASYTVAASTGSGSGTLGLNLVDDDSIADAATNKLGGTGTSGAGNGGFTGQLYTVDRTPPAVTVEQALGQADPTNDQPIHFTAQFSEPVTGFDENDVTLGGSAGSAAATVTVTPGVSNRYDIAVSGLGSDGTLTASVGQNKASDAAGNANTASTSSDNEVTFDTTSPAVTVEQALGQADPTNDQPVHFTAQFSEPVTGFAANDVTLGGSAGSAAATVTVTPGVSNRYDIAVSGLSSDGTLTASVGVNSAEDAAQNGNLDSTSVDNEVTFDSTSPDVSVEQAAGQDDPTNDQPVHFTAQFSESVTGFAANDVTLGGSAERDDATVTVSDGPGNSYDIAVDGLGSDGTLTASVGVNSAEDAAQNGNTDSTSVDNEVTLDTGEPESEASSPQFSNATSTTIPVEYTASDNSGGAGLARVELWAQKDDGPWTQADSDNSPGASGQFDYTPSGDATYGFYTVAVDQAGNREPAPTGSDTVTLRDTVSPAVTLTAPPADTGDDTPTIAGTAGTQGHDGSHSADGGVLVQILDHNGNLVQSTADVSVDQTTGVFSLDADHLDDGDYTVFAAQQDAAANLDMDSRAFTVDTVAPGAPTIDSGPDDPTKETTAEFTFHAAESGGTLECKLDSGSYQECDSPKSYEDLEEGGHTFSVRQFDAAGNQSDADGFEWFVDLTAPQTTIDDGPADPSKDASPSFEFSGTDNHTADGDLTFECNLDGGGWESCESPEQLADLAEGSHTFAMRATDEAGNMDASPASSTWFVDLTAPQTTIDDGPADPSKDASPSFEFSGTDNHTADGDLSFECNLDDGGWESCDSPEQLADLAEGSHTFAVRATDGAGNTDASPASRAWFVDLTAPETTIDDGPDDPSKDASPSFEFSGTDNHTADGDLSFECNLDSAGWGLCSSPEQLADLAEGSHTFAVRATDAAGNTDASPDSYTWVVDTVKPVSSASAPATTNGTAADFEVHYTASDERSGLAKVELYASKDGGGYSLANTDSTPAATGTFDFTHAGDGTYRFYTIATDQAGNVEKIPTAADDVTVVEDAKTLRDTVAPELTLSAPPAATSDDTPAISGTAGTQAAQDDAAADDDHVRVEVLDAADDSVLQTHSDVPVDSGDGSFSVDATHLADGDYKAKATQADGASNHGSDTRAFTVDTVAPDAPTIDSGPDDPTKETTAEFTFHGAETGGQLECKLDSGSYQECDSPKSYSALGGGDHSFYVRQVDAAGNESDADSFDWFIDLTAPTTSIDAHPSSPSKDASPTFEFSGADNHSDAADLTFECNVDGGGWHPCESPDQLSGLEEDLHSFEVRAIDEAGNTDASPASYEWIVDLTAPQTSIGTKPSDPSNDASPTFSFSGLDNYTGPGALAFECNLDGSGWYACDAPEQLAGVTEGDHTFEVRAIDEAGNIDPTPALYDWYVDLTAPETSIDDGPTDPSNSASPSFEFSGTDNHSGAAGLSFECNLDDGGWESCASPEELSGLADGEHTFEVRATDAAGNTDASPDSYTWVVDTVKPVSSASAPTTTNETAATFEVGYGASDERSGLTKVELYASKDGGGYSLANTDSTPVATGTFDFTHAGDGTYRFYTIATDHAGNEEKAPTGADDVTVVEDARTVRDTGAPVESLSAPAAATSDDTPAIGGSAGTQAAADDATADDDHVTVEVLDAADDSVLQTHSDVPVDSGDGSFSVDATHLADGDYKAKATQADGASNHGSDTRAFTVDTDAPDAPSIDSRPDDPTNSTSAIFEFSGEATGHFECKRDSQPAFEECTSPKQYAALGAGAHDFHVRQVDEAGNEGAAESDSWFVDLTAPETSIDSQPSDPSKDASPSFEFSGSDNHSGAAGLSFECNLDDAGWETCASPEELSGLADGEHTFEVRATDEAGNTDASPDSYTWVVDTVKPVSSASAPSTTNETAATFEVGYAASDERSALTKVELYASKDGGGYSLANTGSTPGATGTFDFTHAGDGTYRFYTLATDEAGNVEKIPTAADDVTVVEDAKTVRDTVAPVVSLSAPAALTNDDTPAIGGSAGTQAAANSATADDDHVTVEVLNAAGDTVLQTHANVPVDSGDGSFSVDATHLADGHYKARASQSDGASNSDTDTRSFEVDAHAPDAPSITDGPDDPTNSSSASFEFSGETGGHFECKRDTDPAYGTCSSPREYTGLDEGAHSFHVRQVDAAGNEGAAATYNWTIDTTDPSITLTRPTNGEDFGRHQDVTASFECADNAAGTGLATANGCVGTVADGTNLSTAALGSHPFTVTARDKAGNEAETAVTYDVVDHAVARSLSENAPAGGTITTDGDGQGPSGADPVETTVTTPNAGPVSIQESLGPIAPPSGYSFFGTQVEISAPAASAANPLVIKFRIDSSVIPAGVQPNAIDVFRNGTAVPSCAGPVNTASPDPCVKSRVLLGDGDVEITVLTSAASTWNLGRETSAPAAPSITSPAENSFHNTHDISVQGSAENGATVEIFDGATSKGTTTASGTGTWTKALSGVADGQHTYTAKATDAAANTSPASAERHIVVDTVNPQSQASAPGTSASNSITVAFSASDNAGGSGLDKVELYASKNGGAYALAGTNGTPGASGSFAFTATGAGSYAFYTRAYDKAGNGEAAPASPDATTVVSTAPTFTFTGFFKPLDNLPVLNQAKAGSAVPVKFSLGGNKGMNIFAPGYPISQTIPCGSTSLVDGIEEIDTPGASGLSYDAGTQTYHYVWKTEKSWTGCRQLVVKFSDGTYARANMKFTK
jgi:hypothetical protein